jgi:hypothetical protein
VRRAEAWIEGPVWVASGRIEPKHVVAVGPYGEHVGVAADLEADGTHSGASAW